jgi:hypothetical protein
MNISAILLYLVSPSISQDIATFTVRIENVSTAVTLIPSNADSQAVPLSPGVWAIHTGEDPFFTAGIPDRGVGLEAVAEDGMPSDLAAAVAAQSGVLRSNLYNIPDGATDPGAISPGGAYQFSFNASPGANLSFVTMFVPSNDLFYAPDGAGIALFDEAGNPTSGEVTTQIMLWDAGTEENQEPGLGDTQVQRQAAPNTGPADPNDLVRLVDDGFSYPDVAQVIKVTILAAWTKPFSVRIENISDGMTLIPSNADSQAVPLSPGVWAVHSNDGPLFTAGQPDRGDGVEAIAEDGMPDALADALMQQAGVLSSAVFNIPDGASAPAPIGPGGAYEFVIYAAPGARLSFMTMFVPSNDLFYGFAETGIMLFDGDLPIAGDVSNDVMLWDAGTEENQEPGLGDNQVQRQAAPNTGPQDPNNLVRLVSDGFAYPDVSDVLRVTVNEIEPVSFTVRIENVSNEMTLMPSNQDNQAVPLSPGVWAVHNVAGPIFTPGEADRGDGLEAIAEDGMPDALANVLPGQAGILSSNLFAIPVGASEASAIGPGGAYEFTFEATPGSWLSFVTMFVPSNDLVYAPDQNGIALFGDDNMPVAGDVTELVMLWDAGTEENQEPGVGDNQVQRQAAPNTGPTDPNNLVRLVDDGYTYPQVSEVIRVMINPNITDADISRAGTPSSFRLDQNYPNPFNPETSITYAIAAPARVKVSIFNYLGQQINVLVDGFQEQGDYRIVWNGKDSQGAAVSSGIYLYRIEANGKSQVRKMTLLR